MTIRRRIVAGAALLLLASCGSGDGAGGFDNGSRAQEADLERPGALELELRGVKPALREGVQRAMACERDRTVKSGGTYRIDARRVREMAARYEKDPKLAECGAVET